MASTDRKLKWQRTSVDRLTSLPDELLAQILSWLPTKEATASKVLCKRMPRAFCCITSVDLDDSLVSHCLLFPHLVERSSLFESFVDNVLHKLSLSQQPLTRFRLRFGGDKTTFLRSRLSMHRCKPTCYPNPEPARLYAWISYPLAHSGLRELDLSFHVSNPSEFQFPPGLFTHQPLEVLTLDSNLEINSSTDPPICLPNLKILNLHSFVFNDHVFVARLVSNCPALEVLSITFCFWNKADRLTISSHSLQRFSFLVYRDKSENHNGLVLIETPNLQYLKYFDNVAIKYVININALIEAYAYAPIPDYLTPEAAFLKQLSFARALSNVKHLSLFGWFTEGLYYAARLKATLPMFHNLKTLKLDSFCDSRCSARWDIVVLLIFYRSPLLEELVFMEGFFGCDNDSCLVHKPDRSDEATSWGLTQTIPSCCESHLKRIRIYNCVGGAEELNMIRFLLGIASVLKELVISMLKGPDGILFDAPKLDQFKNTLEEIPRESKSCSIIYSDDEPDYNHNVTQAPTWRPLEETD